VIHGVQREDTKASLAFWLRKNQFARLKPLLPNNARGKPRVDDRRVISGIQRCTIIALPVGERKSVWTDHVQTLASAGGPSAQVLTGRLEDYGRIANRIDRPATSALAALCIAAAISDYRV
jgi:transposase